MPGELTGRRLLIISPYADRPLYGGSIVRIHHLVRNLAKRNATWWVTRGPLTGEPPAPLAGHVSASRLRWLQVLNPVLVARLANLIRREKIDTLLACTLIPGVQGAMLKRLTGVRFLLDEHNVEHHLHPWLRPLEAWICRRADQVWCVSGLDRSALMHSFGLENVRVVPNGADLAALQMSALGRDGVMPQPGSAGRPVLLFFGVLGYAPNRQAVHIILKELAPRLKDCTILIAGAGSERFRDSGTVRFLGFVADLPGLLASVDAVVVPVIPSSGTRLKVLEALASGKPVVSTSAGVSGLDRTVLGSQLIVRDGWDAFASGVREALALPAQQPSAGLVAYDWERILEAL
jgi:glycosyltransferase involved in cell wall biosynthesis